MGNVQWSGPVPPEAKRKACPYSVEFVAKPSPARSLNSLEAGRVKLTIRWKGSSKVEVKSANATIENNAKKKNLDKVQGDSRLKHKTELSVELGPIPGGKWAGEFSIPSTWIEGGTNTYERTGSSNPGSRKDLFTLKINYRLADGGSCTSKFQSADVFHWDARPEAKM